MSKAGSWGVCAAVCFTWAAVNAVLALKGGIRLEHVWIVRFFVMIGGPLAMSGWSAFQSFANHKALVTTALHTDKPVDPTSGASTFVMDSGGVSLRLTVSKDKATSSAEREKIVEAVRGVLAVTDTEVA